MPPRTVKTKNDKLDVQANIFDDIYSKIMCGEIRSRDELHRAKMELCRTYKLDNVPGNSEILNKAPEHVYELVLPLLQRKPMRTRSGVAPVAVMTSPENCPHGKCSYCPGGVEHGTPQSYTGHEPAALRASANSFGPYHQTMGRLKQLDIIGHPTDKIDLIIMGGTFTTRSDDYQFWFIKRCFDALNKSNSASLTEAHDKNEDAKHRCIGMTIETRPDACTIPQVARIMELGGTRVELGVQTLDDNILARVKRGHGSSETRSATRFLKDAGMKVCYHIMPNLPGMTPAGDLEVFQDIFEHAEYRPDMIKIYPTLVVKGTELYKSWRNKEFEPYLLDDTIELIAKLKAMAPRWVRVQRVQRDIPAKLIEAGVRNSNLRQLVQNRLAERGERCQCIRCREIGLNLDENAEPDEKAFELITEGYESSGGKEIFISIEDTTNDLLIGFVRLRAPSEDKLEDLRQPPLKNGSDGFAFVRELKVFGQMARISKDTSEGELKKDRIRSAKGASKLWQHKGYGRTLMEEAEQFALNEWGLKTILVNSGVGVRKYYTKLGYEYHGHYMAKLIS